MAEGNVFLNLQAKDNASSTIRAVADTARQSMQDMLKHNKQLAGSTSNVAKAKQLELTLSQKMRFAIAKETAKGNKLNTTIVNRQIALAKMERRLRSAIKAGDWNATILAKQTVELKKNVKALQKKSDKVAAAAIPMKTFAKGLGVVATAAAAIGVGIVALGIKVGNFGDKMIKGAQRLNLTTNEFQELDYAMKISGTSMEAQRGALVRFSRTARDAGTGVRIAEESFHALGISAKDSSGKFKGTNQLLHEVSEGFRKMPPSVEKTAVSMDLFGRAGSELAQFLNLGSKGLKELGVEAHNLGGIMSKDAAKAAEELVDSLTRMNTAAGGVVRGMGESLSPVMTRTMNQIAESIQNLRPAFEPIFEDLVSYAQDAAKLLVPVAVVISKVFIGIVTTANFAWDGFLIAINGVLSLLPMAANKIIRLANMLLPASKQLEEFPNVFLDTIETTINGMGKEAEAANAVFKELDKLAGALTGTLEPHEKNKEKTDEQTEAYSKQKKTLAELRAEHAEWVKEQSAAIDKYVSASAKRIDADVDRQERDIKNWEKNQEKQEKAAEALGKKWANIGKTISDKLVGAWTKGENAMESFKNVGKEVAKMVIGFVRDMAIKNIMAHAGSAAAGAAESQAWIPGAGPVLAVAAATAIFAAVSAFAEGLNKGGIVPGVGSTDSTLAMLTPGEIVLPKRLSEMLLGVVNQGQPYGRGMGFQQGGIVPSVGQGGGVVINFNDQGVTPRTPAEMDRFVNDSLVPTLKRLRLAGAV